MEKRDAVFYARVKPTSKKFLYDKMKTDGFSSMSEWFDQLIIDIKKKAKKKKK